MAASISFKEVSGDEVKINCDLRAATKNEKQMVLQMLNIYGLIYQGEGMELVSVNGKSLSEVSDD